MITCVWSESKLCPFRALRGNSVRVLVLTMRVFPHVTEMESGSGVQEGNINQVMA